MCERTTRRETKRPSTRTFVQHHEQDVERKSVDVALRRPSVIQLPILPKTCADEPIDEVVDAGPLELQVVPAVVLHAHEKRGPKVGFDERGVDIAAAETSEGVRVDSELRGYVGRP